MMVQMGLNLSECSENSERSYMYNINGADTEKLVSLCNCCLK